MGKPRDQIKSSCFFLLSSRLLPSVPSSPRVPLPLPPLPLLPLSIPPTLKKLRTNALGPKKKRKKRSPSPL